MRVKLLLNEFLVREHLPPGRRPASVLAGGRHQSEQSHRQVGAAAASSPVRGGYSSCLGDGCEFIRFPRRARCTRSGVLKHSVQSRTASQGPSVVKGLRNVPSLPTARACAVQRGPSVVRHSPRLLSRRGRYLLSCSEPAAASFVPRPCLVRAGRPRPLALLGAVCLITP